MIFFPAKSFQIWKHSICRKQFYKLYNQGNCQVLFTFKLVRSDRVLSGLATGILQSVASRFVHSIWVPKASWRKSTQLFRFGTLEIVKGFKCFKNCYINKETSFFFIVNIQVKTAILVCCIFVHKVRYSRKNIGTVSIAQKMCCVLS